MIPALMTPVRADGEPDFHQLCKVATSLMTNGASAVVYAGSMGGWSLLTTGQRKTGVEELCKAGIPVVVGTGAQNPKIAAEIAAHAKEVGAGGLMIIPRQLSRVSCFNAQLAHFDAVLTAGVDLPSVVYNSPYYSFSMKADMFFRLRGKHPHLIGFKEFGGANDLTYDAQNITAGNPDLTLLAGVDTKVPHAFINCGARGAITGIGNVLPIQVKYLIDLCYAACMPTSLASQARSYAYELDQALHQLSLFDEGPDLVEYYRYLMTVSGVEGYDVPMISTDVLSDTQAAFAKQQYDIFMSWWANWKGKDSLKA